MRSIQRLGTTDEKHNGRRGYVVVTVEIRTQSGPHQTTDHAETVDPVELSIQGEHYAPYDRRNDPSSCGQIRGSLAEITEPAPGWTLAEIAELATIWDRWHLNTMRAACAHMPDDAHASWDRGERVECTAGSGYTYGRAWLTEPLPDDVAERVAYLMRDRSDDAYRARGYDAAGKKYPPADD